MSKPPRLDYQSPPSNPKPPPRREHFHLAWLLIIIVLVYAVALVRSTYLPQADAMCCLCCGAPVLVIVLCAFPLGLSYGEQKDKFWS